VSPSRRTAALVLAAAAVLGACGEDGEARPAAIVGGTEIAPQEVVDELEAIAANDAYRAAIEGEGGDQAGTPVLGDDDGTFDAAFAGQVLSRQITYTLVLNEVAARELEVDDECRDAAREDIIANNLTPAFADDPDVDPEAVFDAFPDGYRDQLLEWNAAVLALQADGIGQPCVADDPVAAYFEANEDDFAGTCVSHILVATVEEATAIGGELAAGADFDATATARSTDPSATEGGSLGCFPESAPFPFVEPFAAAIPGLAVGAVSAPVQTEFGFHLIRVDSIGVPELDDVRETVAAAIAEAASAAFGEFFDEALASVEVDVDPRYGTWDPAQAAVVPASATAPEDDPATGGTDAPVEPPAPPADG